ncbi:hypothetical protein V2S66_18735 [Streptomyces sp. V4-01]|uniref:MarR family transcriptional regulator n=1 Tax=Actinacidiphila polyblastidii TaxID=3110430 RepID=A0ABU7PDW8_9ACTN|nr:hypothetical protein [Streptomyces sp. V4-01]
MLDDRIHALTGYTGLQLQRHHADRLLPPGLTALAEAHQALAGEEADVAYHLGRLHQLSGSEDLAGQALLERLTRVMRHLTDAVTRRDAHLDATAAVLAPLENAAQSRDEGELPDLTAPDFAHLLGLVRGARLHQHVVTQRLSVVTASGTRLPFPALQRLEEAGLVEVDRAHPLHAGQPVALTALGRRTLIGPAPARAARPPSGMPLQAALRR